MSGSHRFKVRVAIIPVEIIDIRVKMVLSGREHNIPSVFCTDTECIPNVSKSMTVIRIPLMPDTDRITDPHWEVQLHRLIDRQPFRSAADTKIIRSAGRIIKIIMFNWHCPGIIIVNLQIIKTGCPHYPG